MSRKNVFPKKALLNHIILPYTFNPKQVICSSKNLCFLENALLKRTIEVLLFNNKTYKNFIE